MKSGRYSPAADRRRGWTECGNQVKLRLLARIQSRFVAVASVITYLEAMGTGARKGGSGRKRKGKGKEQSRVGSPARECRLDLDSAPTRGGVGYAGPAGVAAAAALSPLLPGPHHCLSPEGLGD